MVTRETGGSEQVITIIATETITKYRCVDYNGAHTAAHSAMGVALDDCASGSPISVGVAPIEKVEAGAAITAEDQLETDSSGRVVTKSAGVTIGRAMDSATAAGQYIRMRFGVN